MNCGFYTRTHYNAEIFFELSSHDVMLIVTPLFHSGALFIQASPSLYKGCTIILHESFVPGVVLRDIGGYQVTKFQAVPTVYRRLLEEYHGEANLTSLAVCAIGGEPVRGELIAGCREAGIPLRQIMGQTETSILLWCTDEEMLERPGTIGRPVFHADVELVDETGGLGLPGEVGEIAVRGSVCMSEYWGDPVQTERIMVGGWLRTGDLARRDREGYYYLVDRARDMYISGGENVYPAEVERVLELHRGYGRRRSWAARMTSGVRSATRSSCSNLGQISPLPVSTNSSRGVSRSTSGPRTLAVRESLPRTATGKVQKHVLREWLDAAPMPRAVALSARRAAELCIVAGWSTSDPNDQETERAHGKSGRKETDHRQGHDRVGPGPRAPRHHPDGDQRGFLIDHADGVSLYTSDGRSFLDGSSQLMCVELGYREEYKNEVAEAVAAEIKKLPYCTNFWGFSTESVVNAAHALSEIVPKDLTRFFFTPGGGERGDCPHHEPYLLEAQGHPEVQGDLAVQLLPRRLLGLRQRHPRG